MQRLFTLLLPAMLVGCTTQAVQELPSVEPSAPAPQQAILPTAWTHAPAIETAPASPWWQALNDLVLNDLIAQALMNNPDIRIAEARLSKIRTTVTDADPDEQAMAAAELHAAENDTHVTRLDVTHAVTSAYIDARLAEKRKNLLRQRMQLASDLTSRLHRRLVAGLIDTRTLREAEQTEIETRQAIAKTHHDYQQAMAKLALLSGLAPVEFKLAAGGDGLFAGHLAIQPDPPGTVIDRRPDVQAAWQRLLASTTTNGDDDGLPLAAQLEQADAAPASRDALYRKAVLAALQDVETALAGWRLSNAEAKASRDFLEIQTANVHDIEREISAGRLSRIELLKAMLAENLAQENLLLAHHAQRAAFAAAQMALARD